MTLLVNTIFYIYFFQITVLIIIIGSALYFEQSFRLRSKRQNILKQILIGSIKQELLLDFIPAELKQLDICIPILENLDQKISGLFWEQLKERMLYDFLFFEIQRKLKMGKWDDLSWALRALRLCPKKVYEPLYLKHLTHPNPSVRLLAIDGALKLQTDALIESLLTQFAGPEKLYNFPYIDAFLKSETTVWEKILDIYQRNEKLRAAALRILSYRSGFLSFNDIKMHFYSFSEHSRWWALEALKNIPCQESFDLLQEELKQLEWEKRMHAIYLLGILRVKPNPSLTALLKDEKYEIRLAAGWALSHHKAPLSQEIEAYLKLYPSIELEKHIESLSKLTQPISSG